MKHPRRPHDSPTRGRPSTAYARAQPRRLLADDDVLAPGPVEHPRTRGECQGGPRPCPLVGCFYNNYLELRHQFDRRGSLTPPTIKILHPDRLPEDVPPEDSCVLDIADAGPQTLERVARVYGLTRERVRQIEAPAIRKIQRKVDEEKS